jgi:membrane protease YdiL (CAAX protease family)
MPTDLPDQRAPHWGIGDAVAGWVAAQLIAIVVGSIILSAAGYRSNVSTSNLPLYLVAILQVPLWAGYLGSVFIAGERRGHGVVADFGLRVAIPTDLFVGAAVGIASQFLLVPLISYPWIWMLGKSTHDLDKVARDLTAKAKDPTGVVLLVLIVVIGAPIVEELFFRGLLLRSIERQFGTTWAVVGSAVVFGVSHFELLQLPALIAFGVVLALLAVRTRRLGPGIFAHMAFNTVTVIALLRR